AADVSNGAAGWTLRSRAATSRSFAAVRTHHPDEVRPDGGPRRGVGRAGANAARPARCGLPDCDEWSVSPSLAREPADVTLLHAGGVRRAEAHRHRTRIRPRRIRPARALVLPCTRAGAVAGCQPLNSPPGASFLPAARKPTDRHLHTLRAVADVLRAHR